MKKSNTVALVAALLGLWGCGEGGLNGTEPGFEPGKGKVTLTLEPEQVVVISSGPANASSKAEDPLSKFGVTITDSKGAQKENYASYSSMPAELALEAGDYILTASNNGAQKGAAFDDPYYAGSAPFSVKVGEKTPVKVVCDLKSTGAQVFYSKAIQSQVTDITVIVSVAGGAVLPYTLDEKRTGWFPVPADGKMTISISGKVNGVDLPDNVQTISVAAKQLRRITLDIKTSGSSGTLIEIDTTKVIKDVTIAIPDADDVIDNNGDNGSWEEGGDPTPEPTEGPTVVGQSLNGNAFNIDEIVKIDAETQTLDVLMSSKAAGGIQNLMLDVKSPLLETVLSEMFGITGPIDLANPPQGADAPAWVAGFADLGLLDPKNPINGKSEHLFSVGGLMGLLVSLVDDGKGEPYYFNLQVTDAKGTTKKSLTVVVVAPK